ncbi:uncharacterized protein LOC134077598 [Sardina pilchardus]|uniref:uncharacterized protein LOC134077598 n=1 Tax=Sardina pilchardus TaxID=27697 RepID=UPI002E108060
MLEQQKFNSVMLHFLDKVKDGPSYVCCVCHRLLFKDQVRHCNEKTYIKSPCAQDVAAKCITKDYLHICNASCRVDCKWKNTPRCELWICHTCHCKLNKGQIPVESVQNNMALSNVPSELSTLNSLEQHLVALHIPFMKLLALPKGGQNGVHGPVTCVPANIVETTKVLPRADVENSLLPVKLKRKLTYKGHYKYEFVNSTNVLNAFKFLKENNKYYSDIDFNNDWVNVFAQQTHNDVQIDQASDNEGTEDELLHDRQQYCMFMDTCLQPVDIGQEVLDHYLDRILHLAPGEGNSPIKMLMDKANEAKCFPALFPNGLHTYHDKRQSQITLSRYFNMRVLNADTRFAKNVEYIFYAQYLSEIQQVVSNVSIALRKGKQHKNPATVDSNLLKDEGSLQSLLQNDEGYRFLKPIRGTPAFWQAAQKDLFALIRQLGIPTWFCSFSSADMRWTNLLSTLLLQEGRHETLEDLQWADKCELLRQNPVTAARMFDHRWHCFLKGVLMSPANPIGKIVDYFYRVEFQQRGSPHVHCLFWIENAPQIDKESDEDVAAFIDNYVTCELDSEDTKLYETASAVQQHSKKHSKTCKKKGTTCRFNFPKPPSARTFITHKKDEDMDIKTCKCQQPDVCQCLSNVVANKSCQCDASINCDCPINNSCEMEKKRAQEILSSVKDAIENTNNNFSSTDSLFDSLGITQDIFETAYAVHGNKTQVVLKRQPQHVWVNQYNKSLLKCWNANMDIQYVVDAYACIVYIISYISKAEREMGLLLSNAQREAKKERNLDAKSALKKIGSVYLHNRDISAQEAVYRLTNMHLKECSRKVMFIPTGDNVVKMSLPLAVLQSRADTGPVSTNDMWMTSIIDRYKSRPDDKLFQDMPLATFASEYRVLCTTEKCRNKVQLKNDLGYVVRRTRSKPAVIRYASFSETKSPELFHQTSLQLFLPYRQDIQLKPPGFNSFEEFYKLGHVSLSDGILTSVKTLVDQIRSQFEVDMEILQSAEQQLEHAVVEDAWGQLCPEQEIDRLECQLESKNQEDRVNDPVDSIPDLENNSSPHFLFENQKKSLGRAEGLALIRSLNTTQLSIFYRIRQWCLEKVQGKQPPPFHVFITGGAGTGKTHLIKAIQYECNRILCQQNKNPDDLCVLLTAPTGIAAYNLKATTIHSAFCIGTDVKLPYTPLGEEKLNTLRATLGSVKLLVIDEVSMVDHKLLAYVHGRLRQIKQSGTSYPFGNVSVIAVGDLFQLSPVRGTPLHMDTSNVNFWNSLFSVVELHTVVRQKNTQFAELLNRLRTRVKTNAVLQEDIALLQSRETGEESPALHIFSTNSQVQEYNLQQLCQNCKEYVSIKAQDYVKNHKTGKTMLKQGQHSSVRQTNLLDELCIGEGARVMLIKNIDVSDGLVNGVCGSVVHVAIQPGSQFPTSVYVKFDDDDIGIKRRKQYISDNSQLQMATPIFLEEERVDYKGGLRRQFPLRLAWAITVHKVQGLTLAKAVVSLHKIFAPGQAYVALSRVTSLDGLIISDFTEKAIYCNQHISQHIASMPKFLCENTLEKPMSNCFSIYLLNVQSLQAHFQDLQTIVASLHPDCVAVTETWLGDSCSPERFSITEYSFHHKPRRLSYAHSSREFHALATQQHGGVGMYVHSARLYQFPTFPVCNLECIVLQMKNPELLLVVIYRPPSYNLRIFQKHLKHLMDALTVLSDNIILLGDFNVDVNKPNEHIKFMETNNYTQLVSGSTTEAGTLIDHVYIKNTSTYKIHTQVMPLYFSAHEAILYGQPVVPLAVSPRLHSVLEQITPGTGAPADQ